MITPDIIFLIALNNILADDVSSSKYKANRTSQRSTSIYILDVDENDVAKYGCRLVTSDVWAYSYVVLLGKINRNMAKDIANMKAVLFSQSYLYFSVK